MKTSIKKALCSLTGIALMATLAVPTLASNQTILLDGYGDELATVESTEKGQLSLDAPAFEKKEAVRVNFPSEYGDYYSDCTVYASEGPVTVTLMDKEDNSYGIACLDVNSVTYDEADDKYTAAQEPYAYFDGLLTYHTEDGDKTSSIEDFFADEAHSEDVMPIYQAGAKLTLSEPGIYYVDMRYEAIAGACEVVIEIKESTPKFTDVYEGDYFEAPVKWAIEKEITNGTSATTFSPYADCTQEQILTFLWRANGKPEATIENPFEGLDENSYSYEAVLWAFENGLIAGEQFDGSTPCTRAMTATYLWKQAGAPETTPTTAMTDVPEDADYAQAVAWAIEEGITNGTSETEFSPDGICNRAQIVTFLYRDLA